ncbi:MAG TPA: AraC family transcriptional regulator [Blastocatellia bacterium]|nr:AraC family transcriptional regulator [Blastocatellia bacterium]
MALRPSWENAYSVVDPQINAEGVHLWPFDLSFPVEVRFFTFGKRRNTRMTRHDYFELLYIHSGEAVYQIQDRFFTVGGGDLLVISGALYHRLTVSRRGRVKAAALYFLPELIHANDAAGDGAEYLMPFLVQDSAFPHVVGAASGIPPQTFDLIGRIHRELPAQDHRGRLAIKTYLKMILILLVNHYASYRGTVEIFHRNQRAIEQLRPLFKFLEARYAEPVGVQEAAEVVRLSKSHFMRFFKQVTGQSFIAYLNHFRIAKAEELLAKTDKSVAEVGQEVGFCDQSYFGLVFRKLTQMTPLQYKHQFTQSPAPAAERQPAAPSRRAEPRDATITSL